MEWGGIKNGALLALIERERFDVFLTGDKNLDKQQQLVGRPFALLIMPLSAKKESREQGRKNLSVPRAEGSRCALDSRQ
jgi:hypothetical protein